MSGNKRFWLWLALGLTAAFLGWQALASTYSDLLAEILALETQMAAAYREIQSLEEEISRLQVEAGQRSRRLEWLEQELEQRRAGLGQWLNYYYRRGPAPFLAALLGAESFEDFTTRYALASYLMREGLKRLEETEAVLAGVEQERAALKERVAALEARRQEVAATAERLAALKAQKEVALERARSTPGAEGEKLEALLANWEKSLPSLAHLVANFGRLPWDSLTPDRVQTDYYRLVGRAYIGEQSLERVVASDPALAGLKLRVQPEAVKVLGPGYELSGRLELVTGPEGEQRIRFVPFRLSLPETEAGEELLSRLFAPYDLSFSFSSPYPGLKLKAVEARGGEVELTLGLR
ncbi:MAG: murein hydrolase activator EnvC family protein [Moorellales bacterium]